MTTDDQVRQLMAEAHALPHGAAQIALAEQALAHADTLPETDLPFAARLLAAQAYIFGGDPVRAFVAFSWCRTAYDREPARYADRTLSLLWMLKHIVENMPRFPEIELARTLDVLDDMERRWRAGGHSLHAVYQCRFEVAQHVGDLGAAEEWYRRWQAAPRDELSDCAGCDPTAQVGWLTERGQHERAAALAEPVLSGQLGCLQQPQSILTALLVPYLQTGRSEEAVRAHRSAYRTHRTRLADLPEIATHLRFCALTGNDALGLEIVQRHLDWLERPPTPWAQMQFAAAAALVLGRLVELGHGSMTVRRRDAAGTDAEVAVEPLAAELRSRALALAARFDQRNGTGHQTEMVQQVLATQALHPGVPLAVPGTRAARAMAAAPQPAPEPAPTLEQPAAAPVVTVDDQADPDVLLDQAEDAEERGDEVTAVACWRAFDRRVAEIEATPLQRGRRAEGRGSEEYRGQDRPSAEARWSEAADLYAEAGDELRRLLVLGRLGLSRLNGGDEAGAALVEDATAAAVASGDVSRLARAHLRLAFAHLARRRFDDGLAECDRAEAHADRSERLTLPGEVARLRVELLAGLGRIEEAESAAGSARALVRVSDPESVAHACWLHGWTLERLGQSVGAVEAYDEALAADPEPGFAQHIALQRAGLLIYTDRAADAVEVLVEDVARLTAEADQAIPYRQHQLAIGYANTGRPLEAAEVAEEALATLVHGDDVDQTWGTRRLLVDLYEQLQDVEAAVAQLSEVAALLRPHASELPRLWVDIGEARERAGRILSAQERDAEAARAYAEAESAYATPGDQHSRRVRAAGRHAACLSWSGDSAGALAAFSAADELAESMPDEPESSYIRATNDYDAARLLSHLERPEEAIVRAVRAGQGFDAAGAPGPLAHCALLLAELLKAVDRAADAAAPLRRALDQVPEDEADLRERLQADLDALGHLA